MHQKTPERELNLSIIKSMEAVVTGRAHRILALNTIAFTVCFACWMLNGVLVTFLAGNQVFDWGPVEIGWLLGIPVLPIHLQARQDVDHVWWIGLYFSLCAIPMFFCFQANSFFSFALCSFGFGLTGVGLLLELHLPGLVSQNWQDSAWYIRRRKCRSSLQPCWPLPF